MRAWLVVLVMVLATGVGSPAAGHAPNLQECLEAGDFIANAAHARDNGITKVAFLERLVGDIRLIQAFPPQLRWFVVDPDDAEFLHAESSAVFDAPQATGDPSGPIPVAMLRPLASTRVVRSVGANPCTVPNRPPGVQAVMLGHVAHNRCPRGRPQHAAFPLPWEALHSCCTAARPCRRNRPRSRSTSRPRGRSPDRSGTISATSLAQWWLRFGDPVLASLEADAMQANTQRAERAGGTARGARATRRGSRRVAAVGRQFGECTTQHRRRQEPRQQLSRRSRCELGTRYIRRQPGCAQCERSGGRSDSRQPRRRASVDRRRSGARLHHAARRPGAPRDRAGQSRDAARNPPDHRVASAGGTRHVARLRAGAHVDRADARAAAGIAHECRAGPSCARGAHRPAARRVVDDAGGDGSDSRGARRIWR